MKKQSNKWQLVIYDLVIFTLVDLFLLFFYRGNSNISAKDAFIQASLSLVCVLTARFLGRIYKQIWRYGGIQCYMRLFIVDGIAFCANFVLENILPIEHISFPHLLSIACLNLLCSLAMRMMYRYAYKCGNSCTRYGRFLNGLLRIFAGIKVKPKLNDESHKIKIAIIGAGRVGVSLAEELISNDAAVYYPRCFVDESRSKAQRSIHGIPVLLEDDRIIEKLKLAEVQEIVFAIPELDEEHRKQLYLRYSQSGCKIKTYDFPVMQSAGSKRSLREFDIEELLFRKPIVIHNEKTASYYKDKIVLITGGGGSIGSELCRQLAKMQPKRIIVLDIYENGAYDIQQELKIAYKGELDLKVEIASINNRRAMARVFAEHHPQIVINAAAHKHVPLMENNCIEAVENNVFGTKVLVDLCEEFGAERFMMVSTDKAVNPTNVMGATKRMCEMIIQSASTYGKVKYSATRFGNVLGSAGSVIPLFKKQIAGGGPITLTDKRIIRYFMTIPEATMLVLESGAMANNGELFVLDMGQPVKILDLAESMIRLSGASGIEIIETGLRPGEKLYEELLVKTAELDKTDNSLIFIERDTPYERRDIDERLDALRQACLTEDDEAVRAALYRAVPTFTPPDKVNTAAAAATEMQAVRTLV